MTENGIDQLRQTLAADDYQLDYTLRDGGAVVGITAGPTACEDCLIPKPLMQAMLAPLLGVEADRIELSYPVDFPGDHVEA